MAKLNNVVRKLTVEDFSPDDRDLVGKLAYTLNPFLDNIVNALSNNLTVGDNMNAQIVDVELTAPIASTAPVTVKGTLKGNCTGIIVLGVNNVTKPTQITQNGTVIIGTNYIAGLTSTERMAIGQPLSGTGIPLGTLITSITSTTSITISQLITESGTIPILINTVPLLISAPFVEFQQDNNNIKLTNVTGLVATNKYSIRILLLGS